jgi:hypothetical protein
MPIASKNQNQAEAIMPKYVKSDGEVVPINDFQGYPPSPTPFGNEPTNNPVMADGQVALTVRESHSIEIQTRGQTRGQRGTISV